MDFGEYKLTDDEVLLIKNDYRMNENVKITAQLHALPDDVVRMVLGMMPLNKKHIKQRLPAYTYPQEIRKKVICKITTGEASITEMMKAYGLSYKLVTYWLKAAGVDDGRIGRVKTRYSEEQKAEILKKCKETSMNRVAKEYRISISTLEYWRKKYEQI